MMVLYSPSSSSLKSYNEAVGEVGAPGDIGGVSVALDTIVICLNHLLWLRLVRCGLSKAAGNAEMSKLSMCVLYCGLI